MTTEQRSGVQEFIPELGRHRVPTGPFAVLSGSAVVEFDDDGSLLFVRAGREYDFSGGACWTITGPMLVRVGTEKTSDHQP